MLLFPEPFIIHYFSLMELEDVNFLLPYILIIIYHLNISYTFLWMFFPIGSAGEVWDCGPSVRILDASNNCIKEIPHKIAALKSLNVSFLSH
jgi:hypothetical protein